jgi:hypothetical protein
VPRAGELATLAPGEILRVTWKLPKKNVAMTDHLLPSAGTPVELTVADGSPRCRVRVVASGDAVITLSMAQVAVPAVGVPVTLRWSAAPRGRYALPGTVLTTDENRIDVAAEATPTVEQNRHFVRGGGGEHILLRRPGCPDRLGWIRDLSERSIRAHFAGTELTEGDELRLHIQLDSDTVEVSAVATRVASLRQTVPQHGPMSVELIAVFRPDETQAQVIRRYVMRQQMLSRPRP